jgi:hypothetical protein
MTQTNKSTSGTSFHDITIGLTVQTLRKLLGTPIYGYNTGRDKTNYEWKMETSDGDVFTVYDWKQYRPIHEQEIIQFHIGGRNKAVTEQAMNEMLDLLGEINDKEMKDKMKTLATQ